ncbi:MAG: SUMF1/EgtB/PvdO family nonheme iron enzyme [Acidobacteria bacterium]|nr:SUMF1/EgtB/PvdO family nonheme iron enzyme [Acidobacteriota bacterium]
MRRTSIARWRLLLPLLGLLVLTAAPSAATPAPTLPDFPFPVGEALTYRMKWKPSFFIPTMVAGDVSLRYAGGARLYGRDLLKFEAAAVSIPNFRVPVRDFFTSYCEPDTLRSVHTRAWRSEGDERTEQLIFFSPEQKTLWRQEFLHDRDKDERHRFVRNELHHGVPQPLHDALVLIYLLRDRLSRQALPFEVNTSYNSRIKRIRVESAGQETEKTVLGEIRTRKINVRNLFGDMMDEDDYFHVWVTDDRRLIPVKLKANVKYGHVEGTLTRYVVRTQSIHPEPLEWFRPPPGQWPQIRSMGRNPGYTPPQRPDEMVRIPGGAVTLGAGSGDKSVTVNLRPFFMDRYEVTNRQYKEFVDATGHAAPAPIPFAYYKEHFKWKIDGYEEFRRIIAPFEWRDGTYPDGHGDYPVVLVTWADAAAYARWKGKRLPTDAEWEMAARGGLAGQDYPWGDEADPLRANTFESNFLRTVPVGYLAGGGNPYGLMDMSGNVGEWVNDWYDDNPFHEGEWNPSGPSRGKRKVLRGGSWRRSLAASTIWRRHSDYPELNFPSVGFRCARDAE